jgi:NitT/TauT family transport system substrate-binding protein
VTTVFTSKKNVDGRPELVKRFLAGLSKGIADYNAALVDKTMDEKDVKAIVAMIHKYVYASQPIEKAGPRIRHGAMRINQNCKMNVESIKDQLEWFKSAKLVPEDASMDTLVNTSFVETF